MQNKEDAEQLAKSINELKSVESKLSDVKNSKAANIALKSRSANYKKASFTDIIQQSTNVSR